MFLVILWADGVSNLFDVNSFAMWTENTLHQSLLTQTLLQVTCILELSHPNEHTRPAQAWTEYKICYPNLLFFLFIFEFSLGKLHHNNLRDGKDVWPR